MAGSLEDRRAQDREAMALVRRGAARMVAVTLGADGALLATQDGDYRMPAMNVPMHSSVGAGDAFLAAMTLALARGATPRKRWHGVPRRGRGYRLRRHGKAAPRRGRDALSGTAELSSGRVGSGTPRTFLSPTPGSQRCVTISQDRQCLHHIGGRRGPSHVPQFSRVRQQLIRRALR